MVFVHGKVLSVNRFKSRSGKALAVFHVELGRGRYCDVLASDFEEAGLFLGEQALFTVNPAQSYFAYDVKEVISGGELSEHLEAV